MTQRSLAALIALSLVVALMLVAWLAPLPYSVYRPGVTLNVLGDASPDGKPIIQVAGHPVYRDGGQLRMTTVSVTRRDTHLGLWALLGAWFDRDAAVYPKAAVYPDTTGNEQSDITEGAVQMSSSQETATAVALKQLGYSVHQTLEIVSVVPHSPADGHLQQHDLLQKVNGTAVTTPDGAVKAIQQTPAGHPIQLSVLRAGQEKQVSFQPGTKDGKPFLGISVGIGFQLPFKVSVDIDPEIGGPSAGLMFSLGIYDTLTPGSLTGGKPIAGTGEIEPDGSVGPIGGIQQKIPAAKHDGAKLFLVPADNCPDAVGADHGSMRLVKVTTMASAVKAIQTWVKNPQATLPTCGSGA
jgi:PDZ domain-containing protein